MLYFKNEQEKELFFEVMARMDRSYDPDKRAISSWRGENGYHSTLVNQTVHSTRDSLTYAYELLNRDAAGDRERSADILRHIVPLQDTNPENKTYGIWSYYIEEPLTQMSPPDWNWADFCGKELLRILLEHSEKLSADLIELLRGALYNACCSIRIRNMHPGYTNISVMGTYVTLVGGDYLGDESLVSYALDRLKTLYKYNVGKGSFDEYNSPTYTFTLVEDLACMMKTVTNPDALKMVRELNSLAWKTIAEHYHFKTKQWAGPHARAYTMLQTKSLQLKIQRALDYKISLVDLAEEGVSNYLGISFFSIDYSCPEEFVKYFTAPADKIEVNQRVTDADIAVSYMTDSYTIGSFWKNIFWNQRRNLIGYFGDAKAPCYFALRMLHDFYDYSSGMIVTSQKKNRAVSVVGFATDGGDTHCNLDMVKDATISASDLRLRLEFGGDVDSLNIEKSGGEYIISGGGVKIRAAFPYARFGDTDAPVIVGEESNHAESTGGKAHRSAIKYIDVVFYSGTEKDIDFRQLAECAVGLTFEITDGELSGDQPEAMRDGDIVTVTYGNLSASGNVRALPTRELNASFKAEIDGQEYSEIFK